MIYLWVDFKKKVFVWVTKKLKNLPVGNTAETIVLLWVFITFENFCG